MKLSDEDRAARREKRSAMLTHLVDEFKKVVLIALFPVCVGTVVWSFILYGKGVTPTVSPTIPCAALTILGGVYFAYCMSSSKDKKSLNDNGLIKGKDGTISKIANAVMNAATNIVSGKKDDASDDDVAG